MARKQKYSFTGAGLSKEDIKIAEKSFKDYRKNYNIDDLSDLNLLEELVYREIRQDKLKKNLGLFDEGKIKSKPKNLEKDLDENLQQILTLKEKLGLFNKKEKENPYEYLQELEKKFEKHRKENAGDYSIPCPYCQKMIFLMFNVKNYKAKKHPFFPKGKFITNDYLWKLYREGKLKDTDVAGILQTTTDYIHWLAKHIYKDSDKPSSK